MSKFGHILGIKFVPQQSDSRGAMAMAPKLSIKVRMVRDIHIPEKIKHAQLSQLLPSSKVLDLWPEDE